MNSNSISCARAAEVSGSAANKLKQQQQRQLAHSASIAVVDARQREEDEQAIGSTNNQRVAHKSGADRLATSGSGNSGGSEQHIPAEWLQCGRAASANQIIRSEHCCCCVESENFCSVCGQASEHDRACSNHNASLVATNNSSQRGDALASEASTARVLNCQAERKQERLQLRRRQWSELSQRAATSSSSSGSGSSADCAAVFCPEAEKQASSASATRSANTNNSIEIKSAHEPRQREDLNFATAEGGGGEQQPRQPDATFWAKLPNLTRSIIHREQQAAVPPLGEIAAAHIIGGEINTFLAHEVVAHLECESTDVGGGLGQCATGPTGQQEKPVVEVVAQTERGPRGQKFENEAMSGKSKNMTTIKMPGGQEGEQLAMLASKPGVNNNGGGAEDEDTHATVRTKHRTAIKPVEVQRTIKVGKSNKEMHKQQQQRQPQLQIANHGEQRRLPVGATSSLEHLARKQAVAVAGTCTTVKNVKQQQQQQNQTAKAAAATTSNTTTTNTASSNTTRNSSASSLSSCILTETSTARSDRVATQEAGVGGGGETGLAAEPNTDEARLRWDKKMDFLLSIIGFAVDLANIWRFPYLVYKNGGGVFLIPYLTMLIFGGLPLFFLELCLGQYVKKGSITLWNKICPYMKGVGYCSMLVSWYVSFYYNVLIAWSVYYIYRSITSLGQKMPWEDCSNSWNTPETCVSILQLKGLCALRTNETLESCRKEMFSAINVTSPASEFFVKELSQIDQSSGLEDMGYLRTELVLCTVVVYLLHYCSLFRGLETSGKVVWVTATAPYMILSILLVRGLFLPGASMGIKYYLSPRLEKLADPQVWIDAAGQVFYSIGVGFGVHLTYASFNPHNNNCHRDCLVTTAVNALTSVYSGLVVFVYLGYMAANLGIEIDKVASEGYSMVFEVYPEALTTLPFARFWSILFFIMLLTLGIDSAMAALEAVITGLEDEFRIFKRMTRAQLTALVIVSSFLPALISCTQGGAYTLFWFDIYAAGVSLLFAALFETIGVVYCYGLDKFIVNIESMLGRKPHLFYIICWKYISPIFLMGIIFMSIYTAQVPVYRGYTFPPWSVILGWCLAFSSVSAVPILALWTWFSRDRTKTNSVPPIKSSRKLGEESTFSQSERGMTKALVNFATGSIIGKVAVAGMATLSSAPDHKRREHHRLHHNQTPYTSRDDVREEMV